MLKIVEIGLSIKKLYANKEIEAMLRHCRVCHFEQSLWYISPSHSSSLSNGYLIVDSIDYSVFSSFYTHTQCFAYLMVIVDIAANLARTQNGFVQSCGSIDLMDNNFTFISLLIPY